MFEILEYFEVTLTTNYVVGSAVNIYPAYR
jgi:hypothetical protein